MATEDYEWSILHRDADEDEDSLERYEWHIGHFKD